MDYWEQSLRAHYAWRGKLRIEPKMRVDDADALSLAYTPGVAAPCVEIQRDPAKSYELTGRWNTVAVVTDGTAVLGLGDIGPEAGMPVMEGKCVLFRQFGDIDAVPLCVRSRDVDRIVETISLLAGSFGGINLEDISAPRCFAIESRLKALCDIPVFHDDQHGTAIILLAGMLNALRVVGKRIEDCRVVINGAGAAGNAAARLLMAAGAGDVIVCDRRGAVARGRAGLDDAKTYLAAITNAENRSGALPDVLRGADAFIGVSAPGVVTGEMVRTMARGAIVFACANPTPEIFPDEALQNGAAVAATGRSDLPNQLNNVLAFPGVFRGALDVRASDINDAMNMAAAYALAGLVGDDELRADYIIPKPFDPRVREAIAASVSEAARASGVARL